MAATAGARATEIPFLDALATDEAEALRSRGVARRYDRGVALFHEDQTSDRIVVMLRGRVKLSRVTAEGREIVLAVRGPGDLLGELAAIDGEPRSASALALEPVETLEVPTADFLSFLQDNARVSLVILRMLARRLRDADRKRVEFAAKDSVGRVAARLVELADRYGEPAEPGVRISLPISQEELAGWTGSSREAVSKALQSLRGLGWIETQRRSFTILDLEALRRHAL